MSYTMGYPMFLASLVTPQFLVMSVSLPRICLLPAKSILKFLRFFPNILVTVCFESCWSSDFYSHLRFTFMCSCFFPLSNFYNAIFCFCSHSIGLLIYCTVSSMQSSSLQPISLFSLSVSMPDSHLFTFVAQLGTAIISLLFWCYFCHNILL